jgi:hypothetical protein
MTQIRIQIVIIIILFEFHAQGKNVCEIYGKRYRKDCKHNETH